MNLLSQILCKDFIINLCTLSEIREFVEKNHYSHNLNGIKVSFCFSVKWKDELIGAVIYGTMSTTAWKKFGNSEQEVLELRRLVFLDNVGKNAESRMIGYTLRWLQKKCSSS
jgi:hypothetical protein